MIKKIFFLIFALTLVVSISQKALAKKPDGEGNGHDPITICHATGSESNPYVTITVDKNSTKLKGHLHHKNDIIPTPADGCPKPEKDMCKNIDGLQKTVPADYYRDENSNCYKEEIEDICPNINGIQTEVPLDYFLQNGDCIKYTHGGCHDCGGDTSKPQVLSATTETTAALPVSGGNWLFYQSLLAAFGFLITSTLVMRLFPKHR